MEDSTSEVRLTPTIDLTEVASQEPKHRLGLRSLFLLFVAEYLTLAVVFLPSNLDWSTFAFMDQGSPLSTNTLLQRGLIPTVDFGYVYGLIPLLISRAWFAVFGLTPSAYAGAMVAIGLLMCWGLALCLDGIRAGKIGVFLIMVTMPWAILTSYIGLTHGIEAVLICHALAQHARGGKRWGLALLTACLFVKPTMAYVYGLVLLVLIVKDEWPKGLRNLISGIAPAALTGFLAVLTCGAAFGVRPILNSVLPLTGRENYRRMNYGFFHGIGRAFWHPSQVIPTDYLYTASGHYLLGSAILTAAAILSLIHMIKTRYNDTSRNRQFLMTCFVLHVTFIAMFYAARMSWTYYYYIFALGLVAVSTLGRLWPTVILVLAMLAIVGHKHEGGAIKHAWKTARPSPEMANLWSSADLREEWTRLRKIQGNQTATMLTTNGGCIELLASGFTPAENQFLNPGIPSPIDLNRKLERVASSDFVMIRKHTNYLPFLDQWPEFAGVMRKFDHILSTPRFEVYRRKDAETPGVR